MLIASFFEMISNEFFQEITDSSVYFLLAVIGTGLFALRMLLMLIGGDGGVDFDTDAVDGLDAHDTGLPFLSLLSILSFMMGTGWMGLAARREWELGGVLTALIASAFGFFLMFLLAAGLASLRRLNSEPKYDVASSIGAIGRVYLKVPPQGEGRGQIEVTVDGRRKVLPAISNGGELASFAAARVVGVQEGETVIIEPVE